MTAASAQHIDEHVGPWTEDDFWILPEDSGNKVELLDGSLLVSPSAMSSHQRVVRRLLTQLDAVVPEDWEVLGDVNVRVAPARILIPDVVVLRVHKDVLAYEPSDVALVAEVASPSTRSQDHLLKRGLYEAAGIPSYLLFEQDSDADPIALLYRLVNGRYTEPVRTRTGEKLELEDLGISLDPDAVLRRG